jgi:hypothetical protein
MATAEANRKKQVTSIPSGGGMMGMMAMGGGMPSGGGMPGGMGGGMSGGMGGGMPGGGGLFQPPGGAGGDPSARQRGGGAGGMMGGMSSMSPEDQKKMRDALNKATGGKSIQELSPEERTAAFAKMRELMGSVQKKSGGSGRTEAPSSTAAAPGAGGPPGADGGGRRRRGEGGGMSIPEPRGIGGFTAKELENAKLPPPPEEDSQFDVLLRPGLLADVQIIVDKIPNAIHVPMQAVFEKDGKPTVFLKTEKGFEPRVIKPLKRSETVMTIAEGVKPGDIVALADPTAKKGEKKEKGGSGGGAMGAIPGGKQ